MFCQCFSFDMNGSVKQRPEMTVVDMPSFGNTEPHPSYVVATVASLMIVGAITVIQSYYPDCFSSRFVG